MVSWTVSKRRGPVVLLCRSSANRPSPYPHVSFQTQNPVVTIPIEESFDMAPAVYSGAWYPSITHIAQSSIQQLTQFPPMPTTLAIHEAFQQNGPE